MMRLLYAGVPSIVRKTAALLLMILPVLFQGCPARGEEERILLFDAAATVHEDASLTVRERILVKALGREIRRGIIRVFPTDYSYDSGGTVRTEFELLSASLNGKKVQSAVSRAGRNVEIRLGSADVFLAPGEYEYEIVFRTRGWIGLQEDHDELYWNVTGNDWIFPIDRAVFRLTLPEGAGITKWAVYTGAIGEKGQDFKASGEIFESSRPFAPGEGMTVAAAWDKGFATPPGPGIVEQVTDSISSMLTGNRIPVMVFFAGAFFLYYFSIWRRRGKDPEKGTVIPRFEPPDGIEPGFAGFFRNIAYSPDVLGADILHLAVRGALRFEEKDGVTRIFSTGRDPASLGLSPVLLKLTEILESGMGNDGLAVDKTGGSTFYAAEKHITGSYFSRLKDYYSGNLGVIFRGLLLFVPMIFITLYIESPLFADVLDSVLVPLMILFSTWICWGAAGELWKAGTGKRKFSGSYAIGLALLLFIAAGGVRMLWVMFQQDPVITGGYCAAALIVLFFGRIMSAKTEKGGRLSEEIEGLAMFLGTAEKHRLALLNPPEETPRLFEMMLPYALALDVVETWADRFSSVLEKAGYEPEWTGASYRTASGSSGRSAFASVFARSLSGTVKTSAASYSPPSSGSSSYRGGSGFSSRSSSGRGGGGGGGRGW